MWKSVALAIVVLVVAAGAVVGVAALQPTAWRVERSRTVAVPVARLATTIAGPQHWNAWAPWARKDTASRWTFGGPASGPGATAYWTRSKREAGRITVTAASPTGVALEVETTRGSESDTLQDVAFTLAPDGAGARVTWIASGEQSLLEKIRHLFSPPDARFGPELDDGLALLAGVVEAAGISFRVERSAHLAASPPALLEAAVDPRGWPAWTPGGPPPGARVSWSFGGEPGKAGASAYWSGGAGERRGRITLTRAGAAGVELELDEEAVEGAATDLSVRVEADGIGSKVVLTASGERSKRDTGREAALATGLEQALTRLGGISAAGAATRPEVVATGRGP